MAMTARIPMTRAIEFFSKILCRTQYDITRSSFGRLKRCGRRSGHRHGLLGLADPYVHPEIIVHDQRTNQYQLPAGSADDVEWMHRFDGFDEGIFEKAER